MVAMTDPGTGLPADNMTGLVTAPVRSGYTSPTNIGGYLWSTVVARDTGIISRTEAHAPDPADPGHAGRGWTHHGQRHVLQLVRRGDRGEAHGSGRRTARRHPFLSSVDNGWLAAALMVVASAEPRLRRPGGARCCGRWTSASSTTRRRPARRSTRAHPRRLLGRPAARLLGARQLPRPRPGRLVHLQPLRHHGHRGRASPPTSASPAARSRRRRTSRPGARSRPAATGPGRSSSRSA